MREIRVHPDEDLVLPFEPPVEAATVSACKTVLRRSADDFNTTKLPTSLFGQVRSTVGAVIVDHEHG